MHQLDRMEEMLVKLVDAHPGLDDNKIHKKDVERLVVDLFGYILSDRKIEAIKAYRTLTGHSLVDSKNSIERVMEPPRERAA